MPDLSAKLAAHLGDRYEIRGELGRGGTAVVYQAHDRRLDRSVAIKVLDASRLTPALAERFVQEITLEARLNHPHIVPLLDSGEFEGIPYFIMPLIEGQSLRDRLDGQRPNPLPVDEALDIARCVALALGYAHERGIVHRDIKPENILLATGTAVVADFGIARAVTEVSGNTRLTQTGYAVGTVPYMSPEQALADPNVDGRTDLYSLGCTLYEMLVGQIPHASRTAPAMIARRLNEPPPSPRATRAEVSPAIDQVVQRLLAVNPADRYATAKEFIDDLARARTGESDLRAAVAPGVAPAPAPEATPVPAPVVARSSRTWMVAALLLAMVAVGAAYWGLRRPRASAGEGNSIAVLPFSNRSAAQDQEYFGLGMAEELINALTRLPGLRVTGRQSSFALRDSKEDAPTIARRLRVRTLLTGSVRRSGDSLRISAELVDGSDGHALWTGTYDRALTDVFAVQEEIAQAIASELSLELGPRRSIVAPATKDVAAYQSYLRARLAWAQRTPASLQQAIEYYKQAVARDPSFARAWAGLSDTYTAIARNFFGRPMEYLPLAREAALRALSLDSASTEAHAARASIAYYVEHDWTLADAEFRRAIALDSTYADAHYFYAIFLATRQMGDSAIAVARRAVALEPLSGPANMGPGMVAYLTHHHDRAAALLKEAVAANPRFYFHYIWLGLALAHQGDSTGAIAAADEAVRLAPGNGLMEVMRGQVLALTGRRAEASAIARKAAEQAATRPVPSFEIARLHAFLGEAPEAMRWVERAVAERETQAVQLLTPGFESLRSEPRYLALLQQMHLERPTR